MTTPQKTRRNRRSVERMPNLAIGYIRVSTDKQVESGLGMDAQRTLIEAFAASQNLEITEWFIEDEGVSGSIKPMSRPAMARALEAMHNGPASVFLFKEQSRVGRNARDLLELRDAADAGGWRLAAANGSIDNSTEAGRFMFTVLAGAAEYELEMIRSRTREALAEKRAQGIRLGRPAALSADVVRRIVAEKDNGRGWSVIARGLMEDGVQTARGGSKWHASSVQAVYNGQDAQALRTAV